MSDEQFRQMCNVYGFAPSRALREMMDAVAGQAVIAEREACAKACESRYIGDNNREDMEAKRCAAEIRKRGRQ